MPPWAVCVYCASGPRHPELLELATRVGNGIAGRGWTLVSGGGNVSAMGALATGARARGGRTVGVIPKALVHRELADVDADELVITDTIQPTEAVRIAANIRVLPIATLIGEAIGRTASEESVSSLFD